MLTDNVLRNATLTRGKAQRKIFDSGGVTGLYFLLTPGAKGWRLRYYKDGKERLLSLGPWPDVSLTMARSKAETLRKQIELGEDPAARRKREVAARIESREKTVG